MRGWTRAIVGGVVRGGVVLVAYVMLTPEVWPRSVFESAWIAVAMAAGGGWHDRLTVGVMSDWAWFRWLATSAVGLVAALVSLFVLLGQAFGESLLETAAQRIVLAAALIVFLAAALEFRWSMRQGNSADDPERDARREAIWENIRREIAELESGSTPRPDVEP